MNAFIRIPIIPIIFILLLTSSNAQQQLQTISGKVAINSLKDREFLKMWIVAGPFPNPVSEEVLPDGGFDYGYFTDFLEPKGGEAEVVLQANETIHYLDENSNEKSVIARHVITDSSGILDFEKKVGRLDYKAAYAFCYLHSDEDQTAAFLLGSDDAVKVWVNGELVHKNYVARGLWFGEDKFPVSLKKGLNPVMVKVTQGVREWGLAVEVLTEEIYAVVQAAEQAWQDYDQFLSCNLVAEPANRWNYYFNPGDFPELVWEKKYLVEKVHGKFPMKIRWFDRDLNEVEKAEKPGRYAYYAEGLTDSGLVIRRAGTMYFYPQNWVVWGERFKANLDYIPVFKHKTGWRNHQEQIADYTGRIALLSLMDQREGAVLMSYIDEMGDEDGVPKLTDTPIIRDHDYHLALKRKILEIDHQLSALKMPGKITGSSSPILRKGSEKDAGFKEGTTERLREICQAWYKESGEPSQTLVARNGIVIFSEAFSDPLKDEFDINTTAEVASITKLLTGMMFAQFIDQGLIDIDDPVGKFLPDFPTEGDKALTLRHCFTHTGGLWGHEEWGGLHNPWMDNAISNLLPRITLGERHVYNGMGYDLAGKVMEMVANKSIFRLMRENFFDPLGLDNTILEEDLAFGCHSKADEFAVFGQLLLNRGSYGDLVFFSPETFEKILPKPLNKYYPGIDLDWGIGVTWMRQMHPQAGQNGYPLDHTILSKNVIGHGSATSAILRVDLDNNLVICQTRRNGGKQYEKYLEKFLLVLETGL